MTPQMQQLKTKYICETIKTKQLENRNKWLYRALITVAALCMIGLFIVIQAYEKQADLGKAILDSGICVEYDMGYACETPDNHIFIEK